MGQARPARSGWKRWLLPAGAAHLICCGALLLAAVYVWSGYVVLAGAFMQPILYAMGLFMLSAGVAGLWWWSFRRAPAEEPSSHKAPQD